MSSQAAGHPFQMYRAAPTKDSSSQATTAQSDDLLQHQMVQVWLLCSSLPTYMVCIGIWE